MPQEIKHEMLVEFDKWANRSDSMRLWYHDKFLGLADVQSQQISVVSSMSAAILAITVVFKDRGGCWVELTFWSFLLNVILGVLLVCWLNFFNKKVLSSDRSEELKIYDRFKDYSKTAAENPNEDNKDAYWKLGFKIADEIKNSPPKFVLEKTIQEFLYLIFLATFLLGVIGLVGTWIYRG